MYELKKKIGKVLTSKSVRTGPLSYERRIYWPEVSQRLRNTALHSAHGLLPGFPRHQPAHQVLKTVCNNIRYSAPEDGHNDA